MVALHRYSQISERAPYSAAALPQAHPEASRLIDSALKGGQRSLDEYSAKKLLAAYGIPVCPERLALDRDQALEAADALGYPVAVKVCRHDIMHKTESGMVFLNVTDRQGVAAAFEAIRAKAGRDAPVLVSSMIGGHREFLAGIVRQPGFAACVVFGLGGVFTEAFKDTAFRVAPLSRRDAEEMLHDIRSRALLGEFRGMPAVNVAAAADLLQKLSFIPQLHPEIAEIDMNPIMLSGPDPVVVDALIVLEQR